MSDLFVSKKKEKLRHFSLRHPSTFRRMSSQAYYLVIFSGLNGKKSSCPARTSAVPVKPLSAAKLFPTD
jgi:hypothetical protein